MPLTLYAVEQGVDGFVGQGVAAPPLGVEIGCVVGDIGEGIGDLIVEAANFFIDQVLDGDAGTLAEGASPSSN